MAAQVSSQVSSPGYLTHGRPCPGRGTTFSNYSNWNVDSMVGLFSSLSFQGETYMIRSNQIEKLEDFLPVADTMCAKLINALTNCLDVSGNFMETEFERVQRLVGRVVKDPELVLHNDSDNDEDHDADDGEVAQPSIAIPCRPFFSDAQCVRLTEKILELARWAKQARRNFHNDRVKQYVSSFLKFALFEKECQEVVLSTANNDRQILHLSVNTFYSVMEKKSTITGVADVGVADANSVERGNPEWKLLIEGKSAEDIAGSKDGIGQLLLAMFATFLRHGETIWGAALAPTKLTILKLEKTDGQIIVKHSTKFCTVSNPFLLWPLLHIVQML